MFNENHGPVKIDGAYIVESWVKESDNDKSVDMGFKAVSYTHLTLPTILLV